MISPRFYIHSRSDQHIYFCPVQLNTGLLGPTGLSTSAGLSTILTLTTAENGEPSGSPAMTGLSLSVICSQASSAAMPYRSVDIDAAVGEELDTLSVAVSEMCTCGSDDTTSDISTQHTYCQTGSESSALVRSSHEVVGLNDAETDQPALST